MKSMKSRSVCRILLIVGICAFSVSALANDRPVKGEGRPKAPPPEAIEACVDKVEGDSVSFETRRGDTLTGICMTVDDQLVAVPEDHPMLNY